MGNGYREEVFGVNMIFLSKECRSEAEWRRKENRVFCLWFSVVMPRIDRVFVVGQSIFFRPANAIIIWATLFDV